MKKDRQIIIRPETRPISCTVLPFFKRPGWAKLVQDARKTAAELQKEGSADEDHPAEELKNCGAPTDEDIPF